MTINKSRIFTEPKVVVRHVPEGDNLEFAQLLEQQAKFVTGEGVADVLPEVVEVAAPVTPVQPAVVAALDVEQESVAEPTDVNIPNSEQEPALPSEPVMLAADEGNSVKEQPAQQNETEDLMTVKTEKKTVSLNLGVVGSGQAGGRMAEVFATLGYNVCAINTARQDLEFLAIPDAKKLCLQYTLSGSGKDIEIGQAAIDNNIDTVRDFVAPVIESADVSVLTLSLGGGSGSGSAVPMVNLLSEFGKPLLVLCALPGSFDDSQSKYNATQTLGQLSDMSARGIIHSLIIVDNAKIENAHPNLSQSAFWNVSNRSAIEPLHLFNKTTAMPSNLEVMDAMDLTRALLESGNCALFGSMRISKEEYEGDEAALLSAMVSKLALSLPADDFDLKEAQAVGILVTAHQKVLDTIPYSNIAYLFKYMADEYDGARTFKGVYALPEETDDIQVSFIFSGMALPARRIEELKADASKHVSKMEEKKKKTHAGMSMGMTKGPQSQADKIMAKVKSQQSAMGKMIGSMGSKIDRKR